MSPEQDWLEHKKLVLSKLIGLEKKTTAIEKTHHDDNLEILSSINAVKIEIATLKASSGMWGGTSGGLVAILVSLIYYLVTGEKPS